MLHILRLMRNIEDVGTKGYLNGYPFLLALLKFIVDIAILLIGAEGTRLLENACAFPSCDVNSEMINQHPAGKASQWETPQER